MEIITVTMSESISYLGVSQNYMITYFWPEYGINWTVLMQDIPYTSDWDLSYVKIKNLQIKQFGRAPI